MIFISSLLFQLMHFTTL